MAKYRLTDYTFTAGTRSITTTLYTLTINDIVKIVNSTTGQTITNVGMKGTIDSVVDGVITFKENTVINLPSGATKIWELPTLNDGDILYIEIDFGGLIPSYALEVEVQEGKERIAEAIILKGGMASEVASFAELADNINDIPNFNSYGMTWQAGYEPTSAIEVINNKGLYLTEINSTIIQSVGSYAFASCTNLTTVSLPAAQSIGGAAFYACSNITTLSLPVAQTIGTYAFGSCSNLTTLTFGKLTSFASGSTFLNCYMLSNIIIGAGTNINLDFSSMSNATWNTNIDALIWNDNFVSGIINNLFDFTSGAAHTIKLGAYPYAKLTPETIALAAAKNWNITA